VCRAAKILRLRSRFVDGLLAAGLSIGCANRSMNRVDATVKVMESPRSRRHPVNRIKQLNQSAGSWSNFCDGYRHPSGAVISMSRQPSSASSAAFFRAAAAVSRRRVMLPEVSVPVIKNRMGDPIGGH